MPEVADVVVVGSGPSGALAAAHLVDAGLHVLMLDVAHDDDRYRQLVPDAPFSELRRGDANQRRYFLGDDLDGVPSGEIKVGAQLTPPRQFVTRDSERWLPVRGEHFAAMQSLALGGLGAAWGAASFTWTEDELRRAGIHEPGFYRHYEAVAQRIGVSADPDDDASQHCFSDVATVQPPLPIDTGAEHIWSAYHAKREQFLARGLALGRTPLAALSRPLGDRAANPAFDMDFWSDSRRSVFRPRYVLEQLEREPRFQLVRNRLVARFESHENGVTIHCVDTAQGGTAVHSARRLLLCAGALNSARIALHSLDAWEERAPLLCNPYVYLPCVQPRMLGRPARDDRHSLSQLIAIFSPPDDPDDGISCQLYGYRSLLLFKLVKEMPLPAWAGLRVARLLMNSLIIAGLHHSDTPSPTKTLGIAPGLDGPLPVLDLEYQSGEGERARQRQRERALARLLVALGVVPYGRIAPGAGSSIHYAGTLPIGEGTARFETRADGRLHAARRVYVGDSAGFRYLPAKGLTFSIMANAVRVADHVVADLASGG